MNRREFLLGLAAIATVAPATADAATEAFQISEAEIRQVPRKYRRRTVRYSGNQTPGTIVVDTPNRFLYLVIPGAEAIRYGIGVGRQGFSWSGTAVIRRKAKWPTWTPPPKMVERDEFAAKWADGMPGGPRNPLGARALYLYQSNVDTLYRIHGTIVPSSIGKAVSSGCIRMLNTDVADLYDRVTIGTRVVVLQSATIMAEEDSTGSTPRKRRFPFWSKD